MPIIEQTAPKSGAKSKSIWMGAALGAMSAALLSVSPAQAQNAAPRPVAAEASSLTAENATILRVPRGSQVALPMEGITRVMPDDDDVARGAFVNGRAVIEGVTVGDTTVELYGRDNTRQLLVVQVVEPGAATDSGGTPTTSGVPGMSGDQAPPSTTVVVPPAPARPVPSRPAPTFIAPPANVPSSLTISLNVSPVEDTPNQALVRITYGNRNSSPVANAMVRYALDDLVSYVPNSATGGARYDAAARELVWNVGTIGAGQSGQSLSFRVEPIDRGTPVFYAVATVEDASGVAVSSNTVRYSFAATPLLTVFALPDRFLAGKNAEVLVDVRGIEFQTAVDRLQRMGILTGRAPGLFYPTAPTRRAEYAVMTLNGLNLRDLRDVTAIKFVLGRRSNVNLSIRDARGKTVATLVRNEIKEPGEHTKVWDGRTGTGYAPAGKYTYECSARDSRGEVTRLKGTITIVPQTPVVPRGMPSFTDVKKTDWYAGYLAVAEKQNLVTGYPGRKFKPDQKISRVEATVIIVRALGLEDLAQKESKVDSGFIDYQNIPAYAVGHVNVASKLARTAGGKLIVGYPGNMYLPLKPLNRAESALIVQRLVDKETNRRIQVSGMLAPGAAVTIDGRTVQADDQGRFQFTIEQSTIAPVTVAVVDTRP